MIKQWHSRLNGMLRKVEGDKKEWDRQLKYCLLVYRTTPHASNEFFTYELVHERNLRGPFEAMKTGWIKGDLIFTSTTIECVNKSRETLTILYQAVYENEKLIMKNQSMHMILAPMRFEPGDMVLAILQG